MTNVVKIVKSIIMLAVAAFILMVIWGVFTSLNAAPAYSLASSGVGLARQAVILGFFLGCLVL